MDGRSWMMDRWKILDDGWMKGIGCQMDGGY